MPPYTSYFSDAQSAAAQWSLGIHQADKVCTIWKDACTELNTTHANAKADEAEDYFTKTLPVYDDPSTRNSYDCGDVEISKPEFKELVDIQRALLLLRAFCTSGQKEKAKEHYKTIWLAIKRRVGDGSAAESLASQFNVKYCPDELFHYLHHLAKSLNPPSTMKALVFERKGKTYLRVWHRKKKT